MSKWMGILLTVAIVVASLVIYDKWVKGKI